MPFDDLIEDKDKLIDNRIDAINEKSVEASEILASMIKQTLFSLSENGVIKFNLKNINIITNLRPLINDAFKESGLDKEIKGFTKDFNQLVTYNSDIQDQLNKLTIKTDPLYKYADQQSKLVQERLLLNISESDSFGQGLRKLLTESIASGQSFTTTSKQVDAYLKGSPKNAPQLEKYVNQVTRDAISQFDGSLNAQIAVEYDLNAYRYVGSLVKDSRPQCVRWVKMRILKISELDKEIAWAFSNGQGMINLTNKDNFAVFKGGFSCRHMAIPTLIQ